MTVSETGIYILYTVHDTYAVQHLVAGQDYSHMIRRVVGGPYDDVMKGDELVLSGFRLANQKLSEMMGKLAV